jgi:hypothetical protein
MGKRTDLVPVELVDPATGRSIVVYQRPGPYPVARPRSRAIVVAARKNSSAVYRWKKARTQRAKTAAFCFLMFILSWVPCAFGCPGGTLLAWGFLFSYILYKLVK